MLIRTVIAWFLLGCCSLAAADGNRLSYLDDFCDPYYVGRDFPKLTTPQWVGEEGVEAVVVLAIDDMRGHAKWEEFLRPILERLKKIDGRAPVSIMTCNIDPAEPHLLTWLKEGLSIEVHTIDHPCPCLQGGNFDRAAKTYHDCVDLMASIPGNRPVAFRMPCCDSINTPSPRFWHEVFNHTSPKGNYLEIDSSVFNILTPEDESLPRELVVDDEAKSRFRRYLPFPSFVNTIDDYPYPYIIGRKCWEFPCVVPSDWEAQNIQRPNNPLTVEDMQRVLDAVVLKQGVYNLVFHPHGWIRSEQIVELIDYANKKHGRKVKFLSFRDCAERLKNNLLAGEPLRSSSGNFNGVLLADVNADGYQDVVIGNARKKLTRVWNPQKQAWNETPFPCALVVAGDDGANDGGARFGVIDKQGLASCITRNESEHGAWTFDGREWVADEALLRGLEIDGSPLLCSREKQDQGVRLRDFDGDGRCELLVANPNEQAVFAWDVDARRWNKLAAAWPKDAVVVDRRGRDAGLRFVDFNADQHDDIVWANEKQWVAAAFTNLDEGWSRSIAGQQGAYRSIPPIVRGPSNNGAWLHSGQLWVQNEDTSNLADGVARLNLKKLVAWIDDPTGDDYAGMPGPQSPEESLAAIKVRPGLKVELVAAEPLVVDPIAFDWGPDGRLWVVEMRDYPSGMDGKGKPGGRVKVLSDSDGDGRYDKADLFLDNLPFPTGVKVWRKGALVTAAPNIIYAKDTDGDQRADKTEILYQGFGEGNQQHRVNGLRWGLDNWLYVGNGDSGGKIRSLRSSAEVDSQQHDLRIKPDEGSIETISGNTQFGINRDDWGNWFGGNNSTPAWHYVLDDAMLRRNPHFAPPPAKREISVTPGPARIYPLSKTFDRFNDHARANHFTSACSPEIYRDRVLGDEFYGNIFVCEPVHNLIHREIVTPDGVSFTSRRADDEAESEFLASSDNWFRPTMIRTGPDGALWVADMYRLVIEHPEWIPADWQARLNVRAGDDRGRIYRIVPEHGELRTIASMHNQKPLELIAELQSPNGVVRDLAQQLLVWQKDTAKEHIAALEQVVSKSPSPASRLQALCTLAALTTPEAAVLRPALDDGDAAVRRHAIRLCGSLANRDDEIAQRLEQLSGDDDANVRMQLAFAAGSWRDSARAGRVLAQILRSAAGEPHLRAAAISSLHEQNVGAMIAALLQGESDMSADIGLLLDQAAALGARDALSSTLTQLAKPASDGQFTVSQFESAARVVERLMATEQLRGELPTARKRLSSMFAAACDVLASNAASPELQIASLNLVRRGPPEIQPDSVALLKLLSPTHPLTLQAAAVESVIAKRTDESTKQLLAGWRGYTPALRLAIVDAALRDEVATAQLLIAMSEGQIATQQFDTLRRRALLEHRSEAIRRQASILFAIEPTSRQAVFKKYEMSLTLRGDTARGRAMFEKHCVACHRLEGKGNDVGPDLATSSNRSSPALLVAILDPNRAVEDKFLSFTAVERTGRTTTGMLVDESGGAITLRTAEGKSISLLRKDLEEIASSEKSFMPEGFEQDILPEAMSDLIAYVRSVGVPPKEFAGNKPGVVAPADDGELRLPAAAAAIYGSSIVFEEKYKNLGYWSSADDHAVWKLRLTQPARYRVALDYACHNDAAGNSLVLEINGKRLTCKVAGTGTWDEYRAQKIGDIDLPAGEHELVIRAAGEIRQALIDLREVRLTPAK